MSLPWNKRSATSYLLSNQLYPTGNSITVAVDNSVNLIVIRDLLW